MQPNKHGKYENIAGLVLVACSLTEYKIQIFVHVVYHGNMHTIISTQLNRTQFNQSQTLMFWYDGDREKYMWVFTYARTWWTLTSMPIKALWIWILHMTGNKKKSNLNSSRHILRLVEYYSRKQTGILRQLMPKCTNRSFISCIHTRVSRLTTVTYILFNKISNKKKKSFQLVLYFPAIQCDLNSRETINVPFLDTWKNYLRLWRQ